MNLMDIYNRSPIFLQNLFTSFQGLEYKKERYGDEYCKYLSELRKRDYSNLAGMKDYQDQHVAEIVRYAFENSSFYKEFYKGIDLARINTTEDLLKLPILEKEIVRSNINKMHTIPAEKGVKSNTSGTTGTTMTFIHTNQDHQKRLAYLDFFKEQNGFKHLFMKQASFNSAKIVPPNQKKKIFWRDNITIKQRIYSGYRCKGENIKYYVENLNKYKPQAIDGYPSSIYQLAKYIVNNNIKLDFKPIAIFPTAETLLPHYKAMIEKAFNCPVFDQYASSEGAPFINACRFGNLHYCMDTGVIEVDDNGEMIVTCFETHGTPLIRYKIGDKLVFDNENRICECGSCFPIISLIEGRSHDYLQSKSNGSFTSIYLSLVSEDFANCVKAMQFVQNSLDTIDIYIVTDDKYKEQMDDIIIQKLKYSMGKDMNFIIHKVNEITKEPSGKFVLIKNNIMAG